MCGRFFFEGDIEDIIRRYGDVTLETEQLTQGEIFPSNDYPVLLNASSPIFKKLKWGYETSFQKGLIINARGETLSEKPLFKTSLKKRRCIIPVSSFYEWQTVEKNKVKYDIRLKNAELFSLAGLYGDFKGKTGEIYQGFVIITIGANEQMKGIHHRMPVIIRPEDEDIWLHEGEILKGHLERIIKPTEEQLVMTAL